MVLFEIWNLKRPVESVTVPCLDDSMCSELAQLPKLKLVSVSEDVIDRNTLLFLIEQCIGIDEIRGRFEVDPLGQIQDLRPNDKIWVDDEENHICLGFEVGGRVIPLNGDDLEDGFLYVGMSLGAVQERITRPYDKLPFGTGVFWQGDEPVDWLMRTPKYSLDIQESGKSITLVFNFYDKVIEIHDNSKQLH